MIELNKEQFQNIAMLFPKKFSDKVISLFEEKNKFNKDEPACRVYVDKANNPIIALKISGNNIEVVGDAENNEYNEVLLNFIKVNMLHEGSYTFIPPTSAEWKQKLEKLFAGYVKERWIRHEFRLNKDIFSQHLDWRDKIPDGYIMYSYDCTCDEFLIKHNRKDNWWSPEYNRFCKAMMKGDEIVSECFSVFYEENVVMVGIETHEPYRRRGFAYLTASAFIEHCLLNNLEPQWGCWNFNIDSLALAKKLGFEEFENQLTLILSK